MKLDKQTSYSQDDVLFAQNIKMLKTLSTDDTTKDETIPLLTYVCQSSDGSIVPLIADGHNTSLRKRDCASFVQKAVDYRLKETSLQVQYIREGLTSVIPLSIVSMMTGRKLELLVCGNYDIDVESLRKIVRYEGNNSSYDLTLVKI